MFSRVSIALPWLLHSYIIFWRADNPIEHPVRIPVARLLYALYSEMRGEEFPHEDFNNWIMVEVEKLPELGEFLNEIDNTPV
jgi:hypothetical protein